MRLGSGPGPTLILRSLEINRAPTESASLTIMPAALNYFRLINKSRSPVRDNRNGAFRELTGINRRARAASSRPITRESPIYRANRTALRINLQCTAAREGNVEVAREPVPPVQTKETRISATRKSVRRASEYRKVLLTNTKLLNCNLLKIKPYGEIS